MGDTRERKYWLHRISHKMEVSYPLLEKGYLSIGFSAFLKNRHFLENMLTETDNRWEMFEKENKEVWGEKLYKTRYNLWRFLCEFEVSDYVVVPSWGTFSVYKITGKPQFVGDVLPSDFTDWSGKKLCAGGEDNRYLVDDDGQIIDIGFVIPVEEIEKNISRSEYAKNDLISRMKIRQTNANIGDLSLDIEEAIKRSQENNPLNIYAETISALSDPLKKVIDDIIDPNQFERLIKCYFEKIGADYVYIPSKKDGKEDADGDIVARFDALKLIVYVQAKHHKGKTGETAVIQIAEYTDQKQQEASDTEYNSISWVISSADDFSEKAQALAIEKNVRLVNGCEFRKMLIDAGLAQLATEFTL